LFGLQLSLFTDASSNKEDLEAFNVRPLQRLETVKAAAAGNPVTNLQKN
jgi:hypothetical protein